MINENFLSAAVRIRRKFLEVNSDIEIYRSKAEKTLGKLEETIAKIEEIQEKIKDKKEGDATKILKDMVVFLGEVEEEGKSLENHLAPLNKEIERLALEEQELYRNICEKHPDLSEEKIVECVRKRLVKENL